MGGLLGGRPITIVDFHALREIYRISNQSVEGLNWNSIEEHMQNWKENGAIGSFFGQIYKHALKPFRDMRFLPRNARILEYGCAHAPYYRTYREFFSYKRAKWTLADIKNISFLYSNYSYSNDTDIDRFVLIDEKNADAPLEESQIFDVIFCTAVFEHLHAPLIIADMLLDHLEPKGLFVFDYIISEATGLDSEQGLLQRQSTIRRIKERCSLVSGEWGDESKSIGLCVCRKNQK